MQGLIFWLVKFCTYFLKQFESACINFAIKYGLLQSASWFVGMVTVVETALTQIGVKFDKSLFNFTKAQMVQTKHLDTRTVDQMAFFIQVVQACMGSGVLA